MTRGVRAGWAVLAVLAGSVGCSGPQYYDAPPYQLPPPANVGGAAVQIIDQRPEWEKKPFTGTVCLYHLSKDRPDAWSLLAEEANAVVNAMPQKPQRVEVVVTSFRLVHLEEGRKYRDLSAGPNPNPQMAQTPQAMSRPSPGANQHGPNSATDNSTQSSGASNSLNVQLWFSSKDDPRRNLRDAPPGSSCSLSATVRLTSPNGQVQTLDVTTIARGQSASSGHYGDALKDATRAAVIDFGRKFRSGVGMNADQ